MDEQQIGHLTSEQLLFLNPWRPVETDTSRVEGLSWECPYCAEERVYFRELSRLEGGRGQFMVQCPTCDHLNVIELSVGEDLFVATRYGGPHIDGFLGFLDRRNAEEQDGGNEGSTALDDTAGQGSAAVGENPK